VSDPLSDNHLAGTRQGPVYCDGCWIILEPMSPSEHVPHYGARVDADGFNQDITYTLIVE
jgi:hypothetical protein